MVPLSLLQRLNIGARERLPVVLQTEASECGIASLCMIAAYHGQISDLGEMRRRFGSSLRGATLQDIVRIATELGFASRPVRLELEELTQLATPCILHWDLNHFVVLKSATRSGVTIHDPAAGVRSMTLEAAGRHFTGVALELRRTGTFTEARQPARVKASQLIGHIHGLRRSLLQLVGIAGAIELFSILSPLFLGMVIDHAIVSADRDLIATLAIGFGLLLVLRTSTEGFRGWMLMALNASLKVQSRAGLFTHLQNLPVPFFEARHLGDIMSRFGSQEVILQAITTDLVETVLDGLMGSVTLVIMFMLSPVLGTFVLAGAVLYGLLRWVTYRPLRNATGEAIVWGARRDSHFLESLRGIRTVKLFNAQNDRRSQWLTLLVETINRQLTADKLRLLFRVSKSLLFGLLTIMTVWIGANSVLDGAMSAGLLIAFLAYKDQFIDRIVALINKIVDLTMLRLHAERLGDIALSQPEKPDSASDNLPAPKTVHIEFRNVRFRYGEHEPWILDGASFDVFPHESVAIVGPSGGGKTTLLKLLAGLLEPTSGEILLNGRPISQIGLERYRSMIGVVMQDDSLFAGSVAENISFFSNTPDHQRIEDSAVLAAIHEDIVAMPMGYGTLIGDMGTTLSGGQKQRILLARALYRWPRLLLLDEATSHLDVSKEQLVNDTLRATAITRVVIAHRPETIRASDRVLGLVGGRIMSLDNDDHEQSGQPLQRRAV